MVGGPEGAIMEHSSGIKLFICNQFLVAIVGEKGLGQRFLPVLEDVSKGDKFEKATPIEKAVQVAANAQFEFARTHFGKSYNFECFAAFKDSDESVLIEFAEGMRPERKTDDAWFAVIGSGAFIAGPFLGFLRRLLYPNSQPKVEEALPILVWALTQTFHFNTGGIQGPAQIGVLQSGSTGKMEILTEKDVQELLAKLGHAEERIREAWLQPLPAPPSPQ